MHLRYDNLKSAVSRVLLGRSREESDRWLAFRSHYGFDAFYCQPGVGGAHEKGGVEGEGGRFRRNHCVPMPVVDSISELNDLIAAADAIDDHRRIANRATTVGRDYLIEKPRLRPLPTAEFPTWLTLEPRVDRYARITGRQCQYSVPAKLIGRRVRVRLGATTVTVFDARIQVARHERITIRGEQSLNLDHYLEVLQRKPGAMPGATALAQARKDGTFTQAHEAFWAAARRQVGDAKGTRALVEVLLLHRHLPATDVIAGITAALRIGSVSPDVVAVEARKIGHPDGPTPLELILPHVIDLAERRTVAGVDVPVDARPLPSVAPYDDLLNQAGS